LFLTFLLCLECCPIVPYCSFAVRQHHGPFLDGSIIEANVQKQYPLQDRIALPIRHFFGGVGTVSYPAIIRASARTLVVIRRTTSLGRHTEPSPLLHILPGNISFATSASQAFYTGIFIVLCFSIVRFDGCGMQKHLRHSMLVLHGGVTAAIA
jgi:hypothetical protein